MFKKPPLSHPSVPVPQVLLPGLRSGPQGLHRDALRPPGAQGGPGRHRQAVQPPAQRQGQGAPRHGPRQRHGRPAGRALGQAGEEVARGAAVRPSAGHFRICGVLQCGSNPGRAGHLGFAVLQCISKSVTSRPIKNLPLG